MSLNELTVKEIIAKNIKNLNIGTKYSYPKFAESLEFSKSSKKSIKDSHIALILELIEYEQVGKQYIVKGFKDISEDRVLELTEDMRGKNPNSHGKNGIYSKEIGATLLYKMLQNALSEDSDILQADGDTIIMLSSRHDIAVECGIRHKQNFFNYKKSPNHFCKENDLDVDIVKYAFPQISSKSYTAVNVMFDYLKNNGLAIISEVMEIDIVDMTDDEGRVIGEEDIEIIEKNIVNRKFERVIADEDTRKTINLKRMEIAKDLGYKNPSILYNNASQDTIDELHNRLNRYTAKTFGIFANYPRIEIRSSISLIEKHLLKFEHLTLGEFMNDGYSVFTNTLINRFNSDIKCLDSDEERQKRFKNIKHKTDKRTNKVKNYKELYINTIVKNEEFMPTVSALIDKICNVNAEETPSIDKDIKLEHNTIEQWEVFRDNGQHLLVTKENERYSSTNMDEDELLSELGLL